MKSIFELIAYIAFTIFTFEIRFPLEVYGVFK